MAGALTYDQLAYLRRLANGTQRVPESQPASTLDLLCKLRPVVPVEWDRTATTYRISEAGREYLLKVDWTP